MEILKYDNAIMCLVNMNQEIMIGLILITITLNLGSLSSQGLVGAKEIHENIQIITHNQEPSPYGFGPIYVTVFDISPPLFKPFLKPTVNVTVILSNIEKGLTDQTGFCQLGPLSLMGIYPIHVYKQGYIDISSGFKHFKFTRNGGDCLTANFIMIKIK